MRRAPLYVGGWLAAVVIATGVGFAAISLVGDDVGAPGAAVALIASPQASDTATAEPDATETSDPRPSTEPSSTPRATTPDTDSVAATQATDAGTVTGLCRGDLPRLVSWSPRNGWSVADVEAAGTRRHVSFTDGTTYVTVALRCVDGTPTFAVVTTDASPTPAPTTTPTPTPTPTVSVDPGQP